MAKRKLPARDLAADIKTGLSYQDLLGRYSLSETVLDAACKKLVDAGLIEVNEVPRKVVNLQSVIEPQPKESSQLQTRIIPSFKCPHCGTVHIQGDAVCTQCGVLFEALESSSKVPAQREENPRGGASECLACGAPRDSDKGVCPTCGLKAPVVSSVKSAPQPLIQTPGTRAVRVPESRSDENTNEEKKDSWTDSLKPSKSVVQWIMVAVISLGICAIILGSVLWIRSHRNEKAEQLRREAAKVKFISTPEAQRFIDEAAAAGKGLLETQHAFSDKFGTAMSPIQNCRFVEISKACYGGDLGHAVSDIPYPMPLKERIDRAGNISARKKLAIRDQFLKEQSEQKALLEEVAWALMGCKTRK